MDRAGSASFDREKLQGEFGDLFFAMINAARLYHVDPELALEYSNKKFIRRFGYIEDRAQVEGKPLGSMTLDEMEALWQEAKKSE